MPRDPRNASAVIELDQQEHDSRTPFIEILDSLAREQTTGHASLATVVSSRFPRHDDHASVIVIDADLELLLADLDQELQTVSARLDRALSR